MLGGHGVLDQLKGVRLEHLLQAAHRMSLARRELKRYR